MTEPTETTEPTTTPIDAPENTLNGPESNADETTTFDAAYVSKLRAESAESRTALKESKTRGDALYEQLLARTREAACAGVLQDPTDLPADGDYLDESGFPSLDKMRAAAEALAAAKPYLARPRGDIAQGARESAPSEGFGDLVRRAMS